MTGVWGFVIAAYAVALGGAAILAAQSHSAMRRAEERVRELKQR